MKKVLFGLLCLSFAAVMSCGGSSSGTPADANSSVAGATVSACLSGAGNPYSKIAEMGVNETVTIPTTVVQCTEITGGVSGTITVSGDISVTADGSSATIDGTVTEVMAACTVTDTACDFGNVVGDGTLTAKINGGTNGSAVTFTETLTGDLSFVFKSKTLPCAVNLSLNVTADTQYTQEGITDAMTGTICGADWASVKAALADSTKMKELCTAWDAAATEI